MCAVGYQWRSLDVIDRIRLELAGDPPGLVVSRGIGPAERGRTSRWFEDARASGGVLFELASHDIDLQRAVAGPVVEVQAASAAGLLATAAAGVPDLDDTVAVVMRFAGGGLGIVALGWTDARGPAGLLARRDGRGRRPAARPGRAGGVTGPLARDGRSTSPPPPTRAAHRSPAFWTRFRRRPGPPSRARRTTRWAPCASHWPPSARSRPASASRSRAAEARRTPRGLAPVVSSVYAR